MDISQRKEYNLKIVEKLREQIEKYPHLRFHQLLWHLGITEANQEMINHIPRSIIEDKFYEEPDVTFAKIENK